MRTTKHLILASGSVSRQRLLSSAGVDFVIDAANVDEEFIRNEWQKAGKTVADTALFLSEQKALKVSHRHGSNHVIGSDQILHVGDVWMKKPETMDEVREQLVFLCGKKAQLTTGVCVALQETIVWRDVQSVTAHFRLWDEDFLSSYMSRCGDSIIGVSGACCLEREGVQLLEKIEGDYHSFLGLPLFSLLSFLRQADVISS